MAQEWHQTTTAHAGGRVEVVVPDLADGEQVEVVVRRNGSRDPNAARPQFGSAEGRVFIRDDFDEPLDDFKDYV